jgi:hypothetical protein
MALVVTQRPSTTLLSTLERVKADLGFTDTSNDDVLLDILTRASDAIARECGRPFFAVGSYTETVRGSGSQLLALACAPVLLVSAVYEDTTLLSPIDPANPSDPNLFDGYYIEDAEAGALYRPGGWSQRTALLAWGAEAYSSRYILPGGTSLARYTISYTAGYRMPYEASSYIPYDPAAGKNPTITADPPPLPGAVEQACLVTCKAWWFSRQRDVTVSRERTLDQDVTYVLTQQGELPATALGLLRDYRRVA